MSSGMKNNFLSSSNIFTIAEIGSNHNGSYEKAVELVRKASDTGADAVKFQIYRAERKILKTTLPFPSVRKIAKTQYERWKSLEFTDEQWFKLSELANSLKLVFVATVCDNKTVDDLDHIVSVYKIPSGDLSNPHLIEHISSKEKPVIISTGMSTMEEIDQAVSLVPKERLILLHCMASYPTTLDEANLVNIQYLIKKYGVTVGYSDHTLGVLAPAVSVAFGAKIVEKHFTDDKNLPYGDHAISAEVEEFKQMIGLIKDVHSMVGVHREKVYQCEEVFSSNRKRGLYAKTDIHAGNKLERSMIIPLIPLKDGISASDLFNIIGKKTIKSIAEGEALKYEYLENNNRK